MLRHQLPYHPASVVVILSALMAVLLVAGCGGNSGGADADGNAAFWDRLRIGGDEVEGFSTLSDMTRSADIVARGRFVSFARSRELQGDHSQDILTYGAATFVIEDLIRGEFADNELVVEFIINERPDRVDAFVDAQAAELPAGDLVLFLRAKRGAGEAGLYRLVNSTGLWATINGRVDAPLGEVLEDGGRPYAADVGETSRLDEFVERVRSG
jgi:hypothetical protein